MKSEIVLPSHGFTLRKTVCIQQNSFVKFFNANYRKTMLVFAVCCISSAAVFAQATTESKSHKAGDTTAPKKKQPVGFVTEVINVSPLDSAFTLKIRGNKGPDAKGKSVRNADDKKNHLHDQPAQDSAVNKQPPGKIN